MVVTGAHHSTKANSMIERQVKRLQLKKVGDENHESPSSKVKMTTCCWRKCKIVMDDENEVLNDLPDLKTALRTRSSGSSMLETTLIICGASYDPDNAKIQDGKNKNNQIEKKTLYNTSVDDAAFESLYRHSWRHKGNEKVIDKFLITNNSTHVKRMSEHSMDMCLEGFQRQCTEVGITVVDPEQIWSHVAVVKVMQKKSNVLVKIFFIDETMKWNRSYPNGSKVATSTRVTKQANCAIDLVLEPAQGRYGGCTRSIRHYWPVTIGDTLIMFECRIQYYPHNND